MSDRLAVSAAFSVLMMSAFVLFGGQTAQADFAPEARGASASLVSAMEAPAQVTAPAASLWIR